MTVKQIAWRRSTARKAAGWLVGGWLVGLAGLVTLGSLVSNAGATRPVSAHSAVVTFTGQSRGIPRSFLGISIEYTELSSFEDGGRLFDRAISLLRPDGEAAMVLRIGGRSANDAYWDTPPGRAPSWVFELDAAWLRRLAQLTKRDRLRVMLDLNLPVHSPTMAVAFARAAARALGPARLAALEVGNEPDLYHQQPGLRKERTATTDPATPADWTTAYTAADYWRDFRSYARALGDGVPGVPLAGPETPSYAEGWMPPGRQSRHGGPQVIAAHRYGTSDCWGANSDATIKALLSQSAAGRLGELRDAIVYAHAHGLPIDLTEVNSISLCKKTHVADSFAAALWAPDSLFDMVDAGVHQLDLHIRAKLLNAPFRLVNGSLEPRPELYGLAMFARMLGPGARLLGLRVSGTDDGHLRVWAVRSARGKRILVLNKGADSVFVSVSASTLGDHARVVRLTAPSPSATTGVTLAGRWIGPDGRWHGREVAPSVRARDGAFTLVVPAYSAAVLSTSPS